MRHFAFAFISYFAYFACFSIDCRRHVFAGHWLSPFFFRRRRRLFAADAFATLIFLTAIFIHLFRHYFRFFDERY